jgi:hypothetical protein
MEDKRIELFEKQFAAFNFQTQFGAAIAGVQSGKTQLFVFNTCKSTLDEFNSYRYDPEKPKEEPVKENDHLMDAIRYAIYDHNAKVMQMPKPTTGLVKPFPGMAA